MAVDTRSIGSGQEYTTIAAWEAELNNIYYTSAGTDAVGECYAVADFDEYPTIDGGDTNIDSITLTAESASRHDGSENSGVRILRTGSYCLAVKPGAGYNLAMTISWLELDMNGNAGPCIDTTGTAYGNLPILGQLLAHGQSAGSGYFGTISAYSRDVLAVNCVCYDDVRVSSSAENVVIYVDGDISGGGVLNCVAYGGANSSTGGATGIRAYTNSANNNVQNNISMAHTSGGTALDFGFAGTSGNHDYNLSEDASADDGLASPPGNCLINQSVASLNFVSTAGGSEDFHIQSGSVAIDQGVDLGAGYGVEVDINGRDRDASGDTWDIGAHEFVAAAPAAGLATRPLLTLGVGA